MLGRQAFEEYGLDSVWYMPSKTPPHKKDHRVTSSKDRCAMVSAAPEEIPYFCLSDFEIKRTAGYTCLPRRRLRLLREEYQDTEFYLIVGADSIHDIEKWYHPEYVLQAVTFLAADRESEEQKRFTGYPDTISGTEIPGRKSGGSTVWRSDVGASAVIRERIASGEPVKGDDSRLAAPPVYKTTWTLLLTASDREAMIEHRINERDTESETEEVAVKKV